MKIVTDFKKKQLINQYLEKSSDAFGRFVFSGFEIE